MLECILNSACSGWSKIAGLCDCNKAPSGSTNAAEICTDRWSCAVKQRATFNSNPYTEINILYQNTSHYYIIKPFSFWSSIIRLLVTKHDAQGSDQNTNTLSTERHLKGGNIFKNALEISLSLHRAVLRTI